MFWKATENHTLCRYRVVVLLVKPMLLQFVATTVVVAIINSL